MAIFLCGYMGSGKSTLLKRLKNLDNDEGYFDLDTLIENTIAKEFEGLAHFIGAIGFEKFRKIESGLLNRLCQNPEVKVIALGGGSLSIPNIEVIKNGSHKIVFLDTPLSECISRIKGDESRPLAALEDSEHNELYDERLPLYQKADLILDQDAQLSVASLEDLHRMLDS